ncbi:M28 family metallopeptidase [Novosphingobium sp. KCTC 2891]|uniref:M28 family metallopeptidase n=1 Tax=Novosphingobium sp. KCTC 2891 TaxID=2989730 RepID=UPI0022226572|nr:M28 family metallopeptidase [Novosphingobium sp. KCTC 2891]MCW1383236.1 M28 family metallopeptidase [Novosphingobium sp. KCTC 2891]
MAYRFGRAARAALLGGAVLLSLVSDATFAASPRAAAPKIPAVDVPMMRQMIKTLASDEFEGRAPSTPAEQKTLDEIVARFKAAGLQPGNKGSWLQDVPTVEITASNVSPLVVKGPTGAPLSFAIGKDFVAGSYRAAPRTDVKDSELVFVGYGINAPELGWNDYAGLDMKGKTAVILVNDPDYEMQSEDGPFKGRRMTYYGRWTYKFEEAARQGAKAAIVIHDTFPAAYGWNVVESSWTGAQYFVQSANDGMDQTEANAWMQKPVAEAIFKAAGQDLATLTAAAKQKGFKAVPLGLTASLSFDNAIRKSMSHNVVGLLPGKTRPDEVVLYSGHWDHLGRCNADATGDDICNGAVDNATGIAALAAIAKMNKQAGPAARSQVFLAVTLEESGTLGSEYYAANPIYPLAKTVGGVNMDALAPTGPTRDVQVTGGDKSELTAILRGVEKQMGLAESPEDHPERGYYYRSDHFSFAKLGVPMFAVGRGSDLVKGGKAAGEAAAEDYTEHRYHQPSDEYSDSWDMTGMAQEVQLYYRLGRALADGKSWPNWHPNDEFRAIRDKSLAEAAKK